MSQPISLLLIGPILTIAISMLGFVKASERVVSNAQESRGPMNQSVSPTTKSAVTSAAQEVAKVALAGARDLQNIDWEAAAEAARKRPKNQITLDESGSPGDVRLVVMTTKLAQRILPIVPRLPVYPLKQWRRWLKEHPVMAHSVLDWMDENGQWWHTEVKGIDHYPAEYKVGEGQFPATGVTVYGVFIVPGRANLEDHDLLLDEKIEVDYRIIERAARQYGRKNKRPGEPGTGGGGDRNVGLGGPAFKPTQNSNTFIAYILREAGVNRKSPPMAIGWDTKPHFPYSSDADAHNQ